jgi:hypothetical protein
MSATVEPALIDCERTPWNDCFFQRFPYGEIGELFAQLEALELDLALLADTDDLKRAALSGWTYWTLYLRGYLEYCREGRVDDQNIYLSYLIRYFGPLGHDPGLKDTLADSLAAKRRVALRFRDIDSLRMGPQSSQSGSPQFKPITLKVVSQPSRPAKELYRKNDSDPLPPALIDGYHRLFLGRMFRIPGLPGLIIWPSEQGGPGEGDKDQVLNDSARESTVHPDNRSLTIFGEWVIQGRLRLLWLDAHSRRIALPLKWGLRLIS